MATTRISAGPTSADPASLALRATEARTREESSRVAMAVSVMARYQPSGALARDRMESIASSVPISSCSAAFITGKTLVMSGRLGGNVSAPGASSRPLNTLMVAAAGVLKYGSDWTERRSGTRPAVLAHSSETTKKNNTTKKTVAAALFSDLAERPTVQ